MDFMVRLCKLTGYFKLPQYSKEQIICCNGLLVARTNQKSSGG